jgi:hypothetical protein
MNRKINKFYDFIKEQNNNVHNDIAIDYFNNLPDVDKYSQQEDSITDKSILNLAKEISGPGKIVKNVLAKVKTYDPIIKWKAYNIENDTVEYYKFNSKLNIGRGRRYNIYKSIYEYDNKYTGGISTLAEPIESISSGWIDDEYEGLFIDRLHKYFKKFLES